MTPTHRQPPKPGPRPYAHRHQPSGQPGRTWCRPVMSRPQVSSTAWDHTQQGQHAAARAKWVGAGMRTAPPTAPPATLTPSPSPHLALTRVSPCDGRNLHLQLPRQPQQQSRPSCAPGPHRGQPAPGPGSPPWTRCSRPGCGCPAAACRRRAGAAGQGGRPPCPGSWPSPPPRCQPTPRPA